MAFPATWIRFSRMLWNGGGNSKEVNGMAKQRYPGINDRSLSVIKKNQSGHLVLSYNIKIF